MRAVQILEPGGPEVLTVGDVDVREAGPDEVRIAVVAAAVLDALSAQQDDPLTERGLPRAAR